MTYDVYMHFPVIAIMTLFVGAFLVTLAGKKETARNIIAGAAVLISLTLLALLVKPVFVDGQIIAYWMGNWEPVEGYAIGIAIEVDALSLFFGLLVAIAVALSCFYSFQYIKQDDARGSFFTLYLMLGGGVMGIVLSGDLFNIYVMLEVMTFAAVGLTAFRTWNPNAREAAFKYLVVGSIGSSCVLLGAAPWASAAMGWKGNMKLLQPKPAKRSAKARTIVGFILPGSMAEICARLRVWHCA